MSKTNPIKVLFIDEVHESLEQDLTRIGVVCDHDYKSNKQDIQSKVKDYQGIIIRSRIPLDAEFLKANKHLLFIGRSGSGMENIDLPMAESLNINCFNAPEANKNAVAEHAMGMILSLFNKLNLGDRDIRNGNWQRELHRGEELFGKTIGIIGYGHNGSSFAEKLRSFGCKIIAYDKYKTGFSNDFVTEVSLKELKQKSDVISLHIPQNDETKYLINNVFIDSCAKPFFLINTSRGKIVDTISLVNALNSKQIKGACLDVLEFEKTSFSNLFEQDEIPKAFRDLLDTEKVILSPHVAGWTTESYIRLSEVLSNKILNLLNVSSI